MLHKTIAAVLLILPIACSAKLLSNLPADATLDTAGLAVKYAGVVEGYDVTTEDQYVLKLFRIPGNKTRPVLFMHGLMGSSDDFILRGTHSLSIALSNAGYDVWLSNYRGNRYSRRHVYINPDKNSTFWKFGPHQHGYYDLAASIDFVLKKTAQRKLSLIGHSEGTMVTYILGAERPEYNDKIKVFIALAPVCHLHYEITTLPRLKQLHYIVNRVLTLFKIDEVGGYNSASSATSRMLCSRTLISKVCLRLQLVLFGFGLESFESEFLPIMITHFPTGTSRTNLHHLYQIIASERFQKFDYGPAENFKRYGSYHAPEYDLSKITMPVVLFVAINDSLSVLEDTKLQSKELPNVEEYILIEDETFSHIDFLMAKRASKMVHPKVLEILQRHNK